MLFLTIYLEQSMKTTLKDIERLILSLLHKKKLSEICGDPFNNVF